ncbi:MAG: hypothetical protein PHS45_02575 [Bacilli bacterium]|nr:hypothetical protein [Bacilli bacterium]
MKFIKNNKFKIIIVCIVILLLILSSSSIIKLFFPNLGVPIYGNRLDIIEGVEISSNRASEIANTLMLNDSIKSAKVNVTGAIINIIIDVKKGVDLTEAKSIGLKALMELSDDEKKGYDIQLFITQKEVTEEDDILFPIIGYKSRLSTSIVWSGK